ncbi:Nucleoside-diphosphate-sugar epimerase [Micromonospora viridifaciens]|uniref:Nucleoside-diphosphate-sugar epimerase n=1 Tax=Micromonospora viridifaciens TaxID=1881 RepID=A0A1C4Z5H8_MICVI|nr:NAD(P)-dependent oxidoreductase [Micromonospora viridifaciens]SCF28144.1 Nucleoside-diphosphate-sugar epimerase [Micromonospora viridifaciens]
MTRVLLLGARGFLGRHIHAALSGHTTVCAPTRQQCDLVQVDLPALTALLERERPDVVVSAAGCILGSGYDFVRAHVVSTAKLIEAMVAATPHARFIRIGSAAEYGAVPYGAAVGEEHPATPVGEYGLSHLAATRLTELAGAGGRLDTAVLRVFNPVGAGLPAGNLLRRVATLIRDAMERGDDHVAVGLHDTYRDFVDVRDVAAAVVAVVRCEVLPERVFNVGTGRAVSTRELVRSLAETAGFTGEIRTGSFTGDAARSSAVPWMCADITRSRRLLGWAPVRDLPESLRSLWQEYATEVEPDSLPRARAARVGDLR